MDALSYLWIALIAIVLAPVVQRLLLRLRRRRALDRLARLRGATVVTLIHRQESVSLIGIPLFREIDIEDAESVLQAIRETPPARPIEIVLHTPGGLTLAAAQIAQALADHDGPVTAVVPHYAMSGGTLIALAADRIVMDPHAALGPVDPQVNGYPAASILAAADRPGPHDDETLIAADIARKELASVDLLARRLLEHRLDPGQARDVARVLAGGALAHAHPLGGEELRRLGLPVEVGVPAEERALMALYRQPRLHRAGVEQAQGSRPGGR